MGTVKKAFDDAKKWIKKKLGLAEDLVELNEMDAKSRAAALKNTLSIDEFMTAERSTALAQGSFKQKPTQVLVHVGGRDYIVKTSFSSFADAVSLWESKPLDTTNAHWHLHKQALKQEQDFESLFQKSA